MLAAAAPPRALACIAGLGHVANPQRDGCTAAKEAPHLQQAKVSPKAQAGGLHGQVGGAGKMD